MDTPRSKDPELERLKITHQIDVEDKKIADEEKEKEFEHKFYWTSHSDGQARDIIFLSDGF